MFTRFKDHISTNLAFLNTGSVLVACSGGLDSITLTQLCVQLGLDVVVAHCNFGLRGEESECDAAFVKTQTDQLQIPCFIHKFDTKSYAKQHKLSIQMAARVLRYTWFDKLLSDQRIDFLLTAHHADDNLETFLINLSRSCGIDGLLGIPETNGRYVRPLLPFTRSEIKKTAEANHWSWREDSSNQNTKYARNKIRQEVIPVLKASCPNFLQNVKSTMGNLKQTNHFLRQQLSQIKQELFEYRKENTIRITIEKLKSIGEPRTFMYYLFKDFGFGNWIDLVHLIDAQTGKQIFSKTHRLLKNRDHLLLTPIAVVAPIQEYQINPHDAISITPAGVLQFKVVSAILNTNCKTIYVDRAKLVYPLHLRKCKKGDFFYPLGMKGKKKLSKFFKDEKLSLLDKEQVWLLCSRDKIVWVIPYRADERFKITKQTKQLIQIEIS